MINGQLLIGLGMPNISFIFSIIRLFLNVAVSYCLILGKFSLPKLGIAGITASAFFVQIVIVKL